MPTRKLQGMAAVTALTLLAASPASADLVDGKKGIGVAQAIGGPAGFAALYGIGPVAIEGIAGMDFYRTDADKIGDQSVDSELYNRLAFGLGLHFLALRAEKCAVSAGGRFNMGFGHVAYRPGAGATVPAAESEDPTVPAEVSEDPTGGAAGGGKQDSVTSIGFDLPVRFYWFPDEHFSLHLETGFSAKFIGDDGNIFVAGTKASEFNVMSMISNLGFTMWW